MKKARIWELDFARGFSIIMMIFDHLMYDLKNFDSYFSNFYSVDIAVFNWLERAATWYWTSGLRDVGHMFFISVFLLVSGISFTFSKSNLNRSIKLLIVAVLISVITYAIEEFSGLRIFIIFGIIHMYAVTIFITYLARKIWNNDIFIFGLGIAAIALGIYFEFWDLHYISSLSLADMPEIIVGLKAFGADYFGIFPYLGIIMIGTVLGNLFYKNRVSLFTSKQPSDKNIVLFAGKHSLIIFLTHQFILFGLMFIIGYIFGYRL